MATMSREPAAPSWPTWRVVLSLTQMWASFAIAVVWLAVLFTAIYGPDILTKSAGGSDSATIPSGVAVALFATFATWVIAKYGYGRSIEHEQ